MLEITNLTCGYGGIDIVKDMSVSVNNGEILSVIGPNGCGKTTLLRAAAGLLPYKSGSVKINGRELISFKRRSLASEITILSQDGVNGGYSGYTVYETVMLGRYARQGRAFFNKTSADDVNAVEACLGRTGIQDLKDRLINELSGGQLQLVFLARAFAQEPSLILLDEPANHLDLKHQLVLAGLLYDWVKDGKSVIGVFHDINLALNISDRIMVMSGGRNVICGDSRIVSRSAELSDVYGFDLSRYMRQAFAVWT